MVCTGQDQALISGGLASESSFLAQYSALQKSMFRIVLFIVIYTGHREALVTSSIEKMTVYD